MTPQAERSENAATRGPARLLVLGGGGREHALVWSLAREAAVEAVLVAPGSDAIGDEPKVRCFPNVSASDPPAVVDLAARENVDLSWWGRRQSSPPASPMRSWMRACPPSGRLAPRRPPGRAA